MVEKVKRAISLTIENSSTEVRLTTDIEILRELLPCLDQERGTEFCGELLYTLRTCFSPVHRSVELAKYNALKQFHALRLSQLPGLWKALLTNLSLNGISPLFLQSINRRVFEDLMVEHFTDALKVATSCSPLAPVAPCLNAEEENALRYVGGYVALRLMRKYQKEDSEKAIQFVECLSHMAVIGDESSFYNYTKERIGLVDRGGLFHINDCAYTFFKSLEIETRHVLPHHLADTTTSRDAVFEALSNSEDIQFYWALVSADIHASDDAYELLQSTVKLWVTIRGYSLTAKWMEQYKRISEDSSRKKKALRKDISRPDTT